MLDELPSILSRSLTATAIVAVAFVLRGDAPAAIDFLGLAATSIGLLVAGRVVTTAVILNARRRAVVAHRTVLIGGGPLAAEMATLLERYPRYGLSVAGYVDDGDRCDASFVTSHLGAIRDLELVVAANDIEVILVTEGQFDELELLDYRPQARLRALRPARRAAPARLPHSDGALGPHRIDPGDAHPQPVAVRPGLADEAGLRRRRQHVRAR